MSDRCIFTIYIVKIYFTTQKDDMWWKQNVQIDQCKKEKDVLTVSVLPERQLEIQHQASETLHLLLLHLWFIIFFLIHCLHCRPLSVMKTFHLRRLACPDFLNCILSLWKNFAHLLSVSYVVSQFLPPPTVSFLSSKPSPFSQSLILMKRPQSPEAHHWLLHKTSAVTWGEIF